MILSLLHPTRGRPEQFAEVSKLWQHKDVEYLVAVDKQDEEAYRKVTDFPFLVMEGSRLELPLTELPEPPVGYLTAANKVNQLAKQSHGDWLMMISDDLYPDADFIDTVLKYLENFDSKEKIVFSFVQDGRQVVQHGIMSRAAYEDLGYYDNAEFWHVYSDNYAWHLCTKKGWLKILPEVIASKVTHKHYSYGTAKVDGVYSIGNHPLIYKQGEETLSRLLKELYKQRIGVSICVRNNENTISQVLESIRPFADRLHIVNNDSTDNTLAAIIQVFPEAIITDFPGTLWNFGDLKNTGIRALEDKVDWIFVIDSDDVVLNPEIVRDATNSVSDLIMGDMVFKGGLTYKQNRMFRTGKGIKWEGAVHECLIGYNSTEYFPIKVQPLEVPKTANQEPSIKRNIRIGESIKDPGPRDLFYLANSYREDEQYSKAIDTYRKYRAISTFRDEIVWSYIYQSRCHRMQKDYYTSIKLCTEALRYDARFSELIMEMAFSNYEVAQYEDCIMWCKLSMKEVPVTELFIEIDKYKEQPEITIWWCEKSLGLIK